MSNETDVQAEVLGMQENAHDVMDAQERRNAIIQPLIEGMQQREKFLLADRLSRPYSELMQDPDRVMIALAWKKLKTDRNGVAPNFDELLDMTDAEVLEVLGLEDTDAEAVAGKDG